MKNKKKIARAVVPVLVVAGAVAYLAAGSFDDTMVYYKTVEEVLAAPQRFATEPVRVNGVLVPGSIKNKPGTDEFLFVLKKKNAELTVWYRGILPDAMKEGQELIVQGTLDNAAHRFVATEIVTKCPSKYQEEAKQRGAQ